MGPPLGRELEFAELFRFIRDQNIKNVVWLTADVHYTAAHRYDPNRAQFQEFAPFWEFVSGPLNAGTFGPNDLDATFGPEAVFVKAPERRPGQPAALGRDAVLRPGRHRRRQRGDDGAAQGHGGGDAVHAGNRARGVAQAQNSIPSWPLMPARKGCLTSFISVTRSAASSSSGLALRPVTMTWRPGRRAASASSTSPSGSVS